MSEFKGLQTGSFSSSVVRASHAVCDVLLAGQEYERTAGRGQAQPPRPDGCGGAGEPGEGASVQAPAGARAGARAVSSPLRLPRRQLLTMLARERPREPETRPSLREKAFPPRGPSAPSRIGVGRARCKFLRLYVYVRVPSTDHVKTIVFH